MFYKHLIIIVKSVNHEKQNSFNKLLLKFGSFNIIQNGKIHINYNEKEISDYMKSDNIDIQVDISNGSKNFTALCL